MILAIGVDLVHISAFAELLKDSASQFVNSTFTAGEQAYARSTTSKNPEQHLAARYAAKEAVLKALDSACRRFEFESENFSLLDIEVKRDSRGRPAIELHGKAQELAAQVKSNFAHISLSHDGDYVTAFVVLENSSHE